LLDEILENIEEEKEEEAVKVAIETLPLFDLLDKVRSI